jgi:very-short-patch-repair endonuclease
MSIIDLARQLRKYPEKTETIFWEAIRKNNKGYKFLRQHPLAYGYHPITGKKLFFIADFYCHKLKLVIEIDGSIHDEQKEYDALRDDLLKQRGIHTYRVSAQAVETDANLVIDNIFIYCNI